MAQPKTLYDKVRHRRTSAHISVPSPLSADTPVVRAHRSTTTTSCGQTRTARPSSTSTGESPSSSPCGRGGIWCRGDGRRRRGLWRTREGAGSLSGQPTRTAELSTLPCLEPKAADSTLRTSRTDTLSPILARRHIVHEVTSPQAFEGLSKAGRKVRRLDGTLATVDHNV